MNPLVRGIKWAAAIELVACLFGAVVLYGYWIATP